MLCHTLVARCGQPGGMALAGALGEGGRAGLCSRSPTLCSPPRQSMSSLSGPLQVVPDIDDQVANPENPQEVGFPAFLSTELLSHAPTPSLYVMERDGSPL